MAKQQVFELPVSSLEGPVALAYLSRLELRSFSRLREQEEVEAVMPQLAAEAVVEACALLQGMPQVSSPRLIGLICGRATILNLR